jgi:hypothetical protein
MASLYKVYSAAIPTTAAMVPIATGTALKTLLQLTAPSNNDIQIVSWGIDFTTVPTAFVNCELINTTTVAGGTPTAVVPQALADAGAASSVAGFAPATEGTVVATTRVFDEKQMLSNSYAWEWSLGREPELQASQVLRVRVITSVTINAIAWLCFIE